LDVAKRGDVEFHYAIEHFINIGLERDAKYASKVLEPYCKTPGVMTSTEFTAVFAKCIFTSALFALARRLCEGEFSDNLIPPGVKLTAFRRAIVMAGLKAGITNTATTELKEGAMVMSALGTYKA
jgi:hypothetical protein